MEFRSTPSSRKSKIRLATNEACWLLSKSATTPGLISNPARSARNVLTNCLVFPRIDAFAKATISGTLR